MQQVNVKFNDVEQIRQFIKTIDKFDTTFSHSLLPPYLSAR